MTRANPVPRFAALIAVAALAFRFVASAVGKDETRAPPEHGPFHDGGQDKGAAGGQHGEALRARVLADDQGLGPQDDVRAVGTHQVGPSHSPVPASDPLHLPWTFDRALHARDTP